MYDSLKLLTTRAMQDVVQSKTKSISKALRVVVVLQSLQNKSGLLEKVLQERSLIFE